MKTTSLKVALIGAILGLLAGSMITATLISGEIATETTTYTTITRYITKTTTIKIVSQTTSYAAIARYITKTTTITTTITIHTTSPVPTTTTATQKPDALKAYLQSKGWSDEYELFKSMLKDGELSETEKRLIDYFNTLPDKYQNNSKVLGMLKDIVNDGKVTENEWNSFQDWDADGMSNLFEIRYFELADPLVHNDRYVIVFTAHRPGYIKEPWWEEPYYTDGAWECAQRFDGKRVYSTKKFIEGLYDFFVNGEKNTHQKFLSVYW